MLPSAPSRPLPDDFVSKSRKLIRALRASLEAELEGAGELEVRRKADPAKELVKDFINSYRGDAFVTGSPAYRSIQAALTELGAFYQKRGPRAAVTRDVAESVLAKLAEAEAELPDEVVKGLFGL